MCCLWNIVSARQVKDPVLAPGVFISHIALAAICLQTQLH